MAENANTATGGNPPSTPNEEARTFTQEEVNRIVQERLAKERAKHESTLQELQLQLRTDRAKQRIKEADYYSPKGDLLEMVDLSSDEAMEKSFQIIEKFMPKKAGGAGFSGKEPPGASDPIRKAMGIQKDV